MLWLCYRCEPRAQRIRTKGGLRHDCEGIHTPDVHARTHTRAHTHAHTHAHAHTRTHTRTRTHTHTRTHARTHTTRIHTPIHTTDENALKYAQIHRYTSLPQIRASLPLPPLDVQCMYSMYLQCICTCPLYVYTNTCTCPCIYIHYNNGYIYSVYVLHVHCTCTCTYTCIIHCIYVYTCTLIHTTNRWRDGVGRLRRCSLRMAAPSLDASLCSILRYALSPGIAYHNTHTRAHTHTHTHTITHTPSHAHHHTHTHTHTHTIYDDCFLGVTVLTFMIISTCK